METFELRYFLAVATHQNIHRAATEIAISPGSLSKAISRLEDELGVQLFRKSGRNIELTEFGSTLQIRAAEIIRLEESTKLEIQGQKGRLNVTIAGPEVALCGFGQTLAQSIQKKFQNVSLEFIPVDDDTAVKLVVQGAAHLGIITTNPPKTVKSKTLASSMFKTYVGEGHPLYGIAKSGKVVQIDKLLQHPFVSPTRGLLGKISTELTADGWRDDVFPRKIEFVTSSYKLIEQFVRNGKAVAYLPDYVGENNLTALRVEGCPYTCHQDIKLIAKNPKDTGWLDRVFSDK